MDIPVEKISKLDYWERFNIFNSNQVVIANPF